jgi:hypothetical protein
VLEKRIDTQLEANVTMSTPKRTMFFIQLANLARAGADWLDEMTSGLPTHLPPATVGAAAPAAPAAAAPVPPKKKSPPAAAAAPAVVETPAPVAAAAPAAAAPTNGAPVADTIMARARAAAKGYAEVYGRDGLVDVLKKYLPGEKGTLADVPADKLPDLLKELSAG